MANVKKQTKKQWLWEYCKKVVRVALNVWIVWNFYIMFTMIITQDFTNVAVIYPAVTEFTKSVLLGYLFKAGLENVFKIKNSNESEPVG